MTTDQESPQHPQSLNYGLLLLTHIICGDGQIHNQEYKALRGLATQINTDPATLQEMENILGQDDQCISLDDAARQIPVGQRSEVFRQVLAIAYIDGFFSPLEHEIVDQIAKIWGIHENEIQHMLEAAQGFGQWSSGTDNDEDSLSIGAKLLKGAESVLSRSLIAKLAELAPENIGQRIERLQREILLAGPEYDEAIQNCATIAQEDYKYSHRALEVSYNSLRTLAGQLQESLHTIKRTTTGQGQYKAAKQVSEALEQTRRNLLGEILSDLETMREAVRAKKRALNYFSIAFLGKTKAGKSTLHAVVTGEGWESIGIGKQRTTRYNRVYEWKNIRIIDTPGIGAPGGKTDEEIAQSIIEEADVICYVVTDDSIQETEFEFLKTLKGRTKPLIILLNIQYNLRDPRRLEHFLKNPDRWFELDGKHGIGGHLNRIQRYAKQHYANDYLSIVPVMLLAAQLSREPKHQQQSQQLFKASRIKDFLDSIRESIIDYGPIRRSQTLLGSTVGAIDQPYQWISRQASAYGELTIQLSAKLEKLNRQLQQAQQDKQNNLQQKIREIFQTVFQQITPFAEEYWEMDQSDLYSVWQSGLQEIRFEQQIELAVEQVHNNFIQDIKESLEEIGNEILIINKFQSSAFVSQAEDAGLSMHSLMELGEVFSQFIDILKRFLPQFPGIRALEFLGVLMRVGPRLIQMFQSREQRRCKAVDRISKELNQQLSEHQQEVIEKSTSAFETSCKSVQSSINSYFESLISGMDSIYKELNSTQQKLASTEKYLNRAYAKRIVDWATDTHDPLTDIAIAKTIRKVDRKFGESFDVQTAKPVNLTKTLDEICTVLQERVTIHPTKHS